MTRNIEQEIKGLAEKHAFPQDKLAEVYAKLEIDPKNILEQQIPFLTIVFQSHQGGKPLEEAIAVAKTEREQTKTKKNTKTAGLAVKEKGAIEAERDVEIITPEIRGTIDDIATKVEPFVEADPVQAMVEAIPGYEQAINEASKSALGKAVLNRLQNVQIPSDEEIKQRLKQARESQ